MLVPTVQSRDGQVFEVSVIWRRTDEAASAPGRGKASGQKAPRIVEVLNHLKAVDKVKRLFAEILKHIDVSRQDLKSSCGAGIPRSTDAVFIHIDAYHLATAVSEFPCN